jgi:hypothetical protein
MSEKIVFKRISSGPLEPLPVEDVIRFIGYGTPLRFYTPRNELIAKFVALIEHGEKFKMLLSSGDPPNEIFFTIDSEIMMGNDFGAMPNKNSSPILKDTHADGAMVVFNEKQYHEYWNAKRDYWIHPLNPPPHPHGGRKMRSHRRKSSRKMRQHRRKSLRTRGRSH